MLHYKICTPRANSSYASEEQAVDGYKLVWQTALIHEAVTLPAWYLNQSFDKMCFTEKNQLHQTEQSTLLKLLTVLLEYVDLFARICCIPGETII